jgi:CxxC motif-containing protein (DUF1111 family)
MNSDRSGGVFGQANAMPRANAQVHDRRGQPPASTKQSAASIMLHYSTRRVSSTRETLWFRRHQVPGQVMTAVDSKPRCVKHNLDGVT